MLYKKLIERAHNFIPSKIDIEKELSGIMPFVITKEFYSRFKTFETIIKNVEEKRETVLATPFKVFSIEMDKDHYIFRVEHIPLTSTNGVPVEIKIYCIICSEISPGDYLFMVDALICKDGKVQPVNMITNSHGNNLVFYNMLVDYINKFTELMAQEHVEIKKQKEIIKTRFDGVKKINKIKNLVVLMTKNEAKSLGLNKNQESSHRFWVRGHWRKINGIGKNRDKDYCVKGFTFVKEFIKGDENKPLITKTRVIN